MENIFESAENFEAYATISAGYWMIGEINSRFKKRTGIETMIDKATGFDKKLESDAAKELIPIFEDIISAKKLLKLDYSKDEEILNVSKRIAEGKILVNPKSVISLPDGDPDAVPKT